VRLLEAITASRNTDMAVRHLNQSNLAERWCISVRTLERWRWLGVGVAYCKIGGRVVYRLEDVEAYEAKQRKAGDAR
jgi:predicted site-specific integrase-resolvase